MLKKTISFIKKPLVLWINSGQWSIKRHKGHKRRLFTITTILTRKYKYIKNLFTGSFIAYSSILNQKIICNLEVKLLSGGVDVSFAHSYYITYDLQNNFALYMLALYAMRYLSAGSETLFKVFENNDLSNYCIFICFSLAFSR